MPFNASDYIKPPAPEFATDREIQGDHVDLKINDLRRDTITCVNALAGLPVPPPPAGTVTVDSIDSTPTTISAVRDLTPPVIYGTVGQRVVATALGTMILENCSFDGALFTADDVGLPATSVLVGPAGVTISTQSVTTVPWAAWEKVETISPGSVILSSMPTNGSFLVYGAASITDPVAIALTPIYTVVNYGRHVTYSPTFTFSVITNNNMDTGTVVMADVNGAAVRVQITPLAAGATAEIVFKIEVKAP